MMASNILVITPQAQFGEMIRLTLEETGLYRVRMVPNGTAALASCHLISFAIAIVDCDLPNSPPVELAQQLRIMQPALKVMLIPPGNNPHHPLLNGFEPDGFIEQPFFIPDLLEQVAALIDPTEGSQSAAPLPPPWLDDPERVARVFSQLFSTLTAQAGILVRGKEPWCTIGSLGPSATRELATWLSRYTSAPSQADYARFFHLNSESIDVLVYAVTVANGIILALVYPPGTALTRISAQARQCALDLTHQLTNKLGQTPQPTITANETSQPSVEGAPSTADLAFEAFLSQLPPPEPASEPETEDQFLFPWELQLPQNQAQPADSPLSQSQQAQFQTDTAQPPIQQPEPYGQPAQEPTLTTSEEIPSGLVPLTPPPSDQPPTDSNSVLDAQSIEFTLQSQPDLPEPPAAEPSLEDTQPVHLRLTTQAVESPTAPAEQPNPIYTCILLPCRPEHTLYGPAADFLTNWLPQLCLAFGWTMLHLEINLDYLQWQVQLASNTSPNQVVRSVRKLSSQRLFNLNPRYQLENPSGDFWAPGFLIISGSEPPSTALVRQHIQLTRRRQGLVN